MHKKTKPFRSTQKQRDDLAHIKKILAERGYKIFTPIKRHRRNPNDFLAINDRECHLIRIGRNVIEIRSYLKIPALGRDGFLKRDRIQTPLRYIRVLPLFEGSWKAIIDPRQHQEFKQVHSK
jgi:hypothetical protein